MNYRSLLAFAAFTVSLAAQSMPTYWRLADPDAKMLAGIDLKAVMNSAAASDWKAQLEQATGGKFQLKALDEGGEMMSLLSSVDRVFLSLGSIPTGTSTVPKMAVALQGNFDLAALRGMMRKQGGAKTVYRGVEIWQSGKAADNVMIAIASPQTLAVGDKASVRRAIDQFAVGNASVMGTEIFRRAAALAETNDVWIAGAIPAQPAAKAGKAAKDDSSMQAQLMKSIESFDLGVRLRAGLDLEVNLYADNEETAKNLTSMFGALMQLTAGQQQDPKMADFLGRIQLGSEGQEIRMAASWTTEELSAMAQLAGRKAPVDLSAGLPTLARTSGRAPNSMPAAAVTASVEPARPPKPLKVRIYNPDSGLKEFELAKD